MSILKEYRRERRVLEIPNYRREDLGTVVRYSPNRPDADGIVCFANLSVGELAAEIQRHIDHFEAIATRFEWKVYDSDKPGCLKDKLVDAGFEKGDPEILMIYDLARFQSVDRLGRDNIDVRRIESIELLNQIAEFQELIWQRSFPWLLDQLQSTWNECAFFAAYDHRRLVGTGWIEYPEDSQFPELHGGAVLPNYRARF